MNFGNPERHDPKTVMEMLGNNGQCYYGNFPQVTLEEQIQLARRKDGRYNAFISASCPVQQQERVIDQFRKLIDDEKADIL